MNKEEFIEMYESGQLPDSLTLGGYKLLNRREIGKYHYCLSNHYHNLKGGSQVNPVMLRNEGTTCNLCFLILNQ